MIISFPIKANKNNNQLEGDEEEGGIVSAAGTDRTIFPLLWDTSMLHLPSWVVGISTIPGHPKVKEEKSNNYLAQ